MDLLVVARPRMVLIDYDVPVPVPTFPPNMNGIVLSQFADMSPAFSVGQYFSRRDFGVDWSPQTSNVVVGDVNNNGIDDVVLQARRSGNLSYWVPGSANGTFGAGAALSTSYNWAADNVRLFGINGRQVLFDVVPATLFAQMVAPSGAEPGHRSRDHGGA